MAGLSSTIFSPSIAILNRLNFTWKFILLFVLYLIPISYFAIISLTEFTKLIGKTGLESKGLQYMEISRPLLEHLGNVRGVTNIYLSGDTTVKAKINSLHAVINKKLLKLVTLDKTLTEIIHTKDRVVEINNEWKVVSATVLTLSADKAFTQYSKIITMLLSLNAHVLESSKLLLDPLLDTNFMANTLAIRLPVVLESLARARDQGAGIITRGHFSPDSYVKLNNYIQNIAIANADLQHSIDVIFENNNDVSLRLSDLRKNSNQETQSYIKISQEQVLEPAQFLIKTEQYFTRGTEVIETNLKFYDDMMTVLTSILAQRISNYHNEIIISISSSLLLLFTALYIFGGFQQSLMTSINRIKKAVHDMADGDLTTKVTIQAHDEMQFIAKDMNVMIEKINALMSQVVSCANQVVDSSEQSGSASKDTLEGVNKQNKELELIATAMNQMSATVQEVAKNASSTTDATRNADQEATNGRNVVNQTIDSINELSNDMQQAGGVIKQLEEDTDSIGSVLDVIRGIAEQTNLLALNAAIEAARAGEQGRGFAVVADEVRTLASRTQDSTQEIHTMIEKLQQGSRNAVKVMEEGTEQTEKTVSQAAEAGTTLESIAAAVNHITSMNEQIASAAVQQSSVATEINRNVVNVRDIALETVSNANRTAQSSESLSRVASELQHLVAEFKINT